jgi:hypothetical protein
MRVGLFCSLRTCASPPKNWAAACGGQSMNLKALSPKKMTRGTLGGLAYYTQPADCHHRAPRQTGDERSENYV